MRQEITSTAEVSEKQYGITFLGMMPPAAGSSAKEIRCQGWQVTSCKPFYKLLHTCILQDPSAPSVMASDIWTVEAIWQIKNLVTLNVEPRPCTWLVTRPCHLSDPRDSSAYQWGSDDVIAWLHRRDPTATLAPHLITTVSWRLVHDEGEIRQSRFLSHDLPWT